MLDLGRLGGVDACQMHKVYDKWPEAAAEGLEAAQGTAEYSGKHVIFAGMGGSGSISDLFASLFSSTPTHVDVVKGYKLPQTAGKDTLVVATSVSGNTRETLSVLKSAHDAGCKCMAFSSGGAMGQKCKDMGISWAEIPMRHSPRASFASFAYHMMGALLPILPISKNDISESQNCLHKMRDSISSENLSDSNEALSLAEWLPKAPVIYYPWGLHAAAIRFKNSLQENAKMQASAEDVIEACHNGIVPWSGYRGKGPVLIRGSEDHEDTQKRWDILGEFLSGQGLEFRRVLAPSGSILTKLVCLTYLLDYSSIYSAAIRGIDPTPIAAIDFMKERY